MTKIKYSPSSIALGLNIENFFKTRDKASASQVITWLCPKNDFGVGIPDIKSVLERMIQPIAHKIQYKQYCLEKEAYVKKELETPSFGVIEGNEEGKYVQRLPTEEEIRSNFRPFRYSLDLAQLDQCEVSFFLNTNKEGLVPLISLEVYSAVFKSIRDIKYFQADEFFKRLINKEATKGEISKSVYNLFKEKYPDLEIKTVQYMSSWQAVNKELPWLQAHPTFQSWREITNQARSKGDQS